MSIERARRHIVVAGAMGVGKTTVGRLVAGALGRPFFDSDEILEKRSGKTGAEIAAADGVDQLHRLELDVFLDVCETPEPAVIAPAASVVDSEEGRDAMSGQITVHLFASEAVMASRLGSSDHRRPIDPETRADLLRRREPHMQALSDIAVDTSGIDPDQVVAEILNRLDAI